MNFQRIISADEGVWDDQGEGFVHTIGIATKGCGCCSGKYILTAELLDEAIADAQAWLNELNAIKEERKGLPF